MIKNLLIFLLLYTLLLFSGCTKTGIQQESKQSPYQLYWGDIHNHNAVGYARGSLERSYDIAQSHLDFFCFTGHSQWHDMPIMPQNKHMKWVNGFEVMNQNWDKNKQLANSTYRPGKFVTFLGYEWHSNSVGDACIIFPEEEANLVYLKKFEELQRYAKSKNAILIPHHPAYKTSWRGQDWSVIKTDVSPVVEIFSEHGNAESDRSPFRYIRHSMGGRVTTNTVQSLWEQGVQVGILASTDDHLGFPGAYGEGLAAVYADTLTRQSIFEAIKNRRTYGVNADRIILDFRLNGSWMGEKIPYSNSRKITVKVEGKDVIDRVEVLRNNQVIYRNFPIDRDITDRSWEKPILCRIEFGWGPWGDLDMARVCDWDFKISLENGEIVSATPCFQSGPFDEDRRNNLEILNKNSYGVKSYTSRTQAYEERATNSIVLKIQGNPETKLFLQFSKPIKQRLSTTLQALAKSSVVEFTGPFTSESILIHRLVFSENYQTSFVINDKHHSDQTDWYYVRVAQTNNSYAWSSPIWVEAK
jgi:hypothetical protein